MRAIFIDSNNKQISEIQIENHLQAFYDKIGCDLIQCFDLGGNHTLICDEEGRLRNLSMGFTFAESQVFVGNALIVGTDDKSDFTDVNAPVCLFSRDVEFVDMEIDPLPNPKWTFIPLD